MLFRLTPAPAQGSPLEHQTFLYTQLHLSHGAQAYTDAKSLRYGHLMIMTDQDHDGSHISVRDISVQSPETGGKGTLSWGSQRYKP